MGGPGAAPKHLVLVAEEDLGVLRVGKGLEAGIGEEVRAGPLPGPAHRLQRGRRRLPLPLARQSLAGPAGEGGGLAPGDVGQRLRGGESQPPSPSRSQYRGGSAPVASMNSIYAPLAAGVRSISNAAAPTRCR